MMLIEWLREQWIVSIVGSLLALVAATLNVAVQRDRNIREHPMAITGRNIAIGGDALVILALLALPWGRWWDQVALFVLLLLLGVGLILIGSSLITLERICARWNVRPWDGVERRRFERRQPWHRRRGDRRKGEQRAAVTQPGDFDDAPHHHWET